MQRRGDWGNEEFELTWSGLNSCIAQGCGAQLGAKPPNFSPSSPSLWKSQGSGLESCVLSDGVRLLKGSASTGRWLQAVVRLVQGLPVPGAF